MPRRRIGTLLVVIALWFSALRCAMPDLAADRAALLGFRAAVGPRLPWNVSAGASPCGWRGVTCDAGGGRVVALQLPGASLFGQVPLGTLGNLTALRKLSLHSNALSGGIPSDIGNCSELRYLFLHGNKLAGGIPEGFFALNLLQRLDLSNNLITGVVSPAFNKLPRLATLYLQSNGLNGTLPADLDLPQLQLFNVSDNSQLTGPVPATLAGKPASAFSGTGLCGGPLTPCTGPAPPTPSPSQEGKSSTLSAGAIAGIVAGGASAVLVLLAVAVLLCSRCRKTKEDTSVETAAGGGNQDASPVTVTVATTERTETKQPRSSQTTAASDAKKLVFVGGQPDTPYDLEALLHASAEVLGKGWLGTTYRARLEGGAVAVTVKRLREAPVPETDFRRTAAALGALRHENLVPLRAYYYSREEKLLVYDLVTAGGLSSLLHGKPTAGGGGARLDFAARARVALAAARGVAYIHSAGACHGNIKSSNVLVAEARDGAYVTDHGLVQLVGASVPLKRVTGYRAPEVSDPRRTTPEADVYSFGVLLLELLTGRPPANSLPEGDGSVVDLPQWVRTVVQEEWTGEVFDAAIADEASVEEEMVRMLQLATDCTEQRPDRRPAMAEVEARIAHIVDSALRKADADEFMSADQSA